MKPQVAKARKEAFTGTVVALVDSGSGSAAEVLARVLQLERVGVSPDVALLPTPDDLAAGRDPALARAVTMAGGTLDAVAAGKLFPPVRE